MEPVWVQRNADEKIVGVFANKSPGAEEQLPGDDEEVVAFYAERSAPVPGMTPPSLVAAVLQVGVASGDVSAVSGMFNVAAVMYIDVGVYYMFFMSSQADDAYDVVINGGAPVMAVTEKGTYYICISAYDAIGGNAIDPPNFGVQVYRV